MLVTALHEPSYLLPPDQHSSNLTTIDIISDIPGFDGDTGQSISSLQERITQASGSGAEILIDALDIIVEEYSAFKAINLIQTILHKSKPPSRLVLLLPHDSHLLETLIPPSFSPAVTMVHPLHPSVVTYLSKSYLSPITADPPFWMILEKAKERKVPEQLAFQGEEGVEVCGDWTQRGVKGAIVQVLVRKATGGVKGISRSLLALMPTPTGELAVRPIKDLSDLKPFNLPSGTEGVNGTRRIEGAAPKTHSDMNLPFNLSLTDEQKRRRGQVPLPYAHEGEGVELMEYGDDEDEDDEEI